jgi:hypothetical protein
VVAVDHFQGPQQGFVAHPPPGRGEVEVGVHQGEQEVGGVGRAPASVPLGPGEGHFGVLLELLAVGDGVQLVLHHEASLVVTALGDQVEVAPLAPHLEPVQRVGPFEQGPQRGARDGVLRHEPAESVAVEQFLGSARHRPEEVAFHRTEQRFDLLGQTGLEGTDLGERRRRLHGSCRAEGGDPVQVSGRDVLDRVLRTL